MALTTSLIEYNGLKIENPYIKLMHVNGGKVGGKWYGVFMIYVDKKCANTKRPATPESIKLNIPWVAGIAPESALYKALKESTGYTDI